MASEQRYPLVSPIGRIVEGDPWTPREKDGDGNIRVYKTGPNAGKPNPQYYIGLAIPKWVPHPQTGQMVDNPDFAAFYGQIDHIARTSWPNLFPNGGQCIAADFSWKIRDGDGFVKKGKNAGKPLADRPGFAGHWIVSFSSSFAPSIVVETSPGQYAEITDPKLLQRGYWARIGTSVSSNGSTNTPGLYVNLGSGGLRASRNASPYAHGLGRCANRVGRSPGWCSGIRWGSSGVSRAPTGSGIRWSPCAECGRPGPRVFCPGCDAIGW